MKNSNDVQNITKIGNEDLADVMAMLPTDKAKYFCKLIGCSGIRKECLDGDVNCTILKPFLKGN